MINKIVVSGMRPTGRLHLGNYTSVIKNWIKLQNDYTCFFFVADIHSLTTSLENIITLKYYTKIIIKEWLATGINPEKCNIFIQSNIPETFELHTILSMIAPVSWLERVPTYKSEKNKKTYGFLGYPILQGADILILNADYVPVGEDQLPHLELIRELVRKTNTILKKLTNSSNNLFKEPQPILNQHKNILGIDGNKMSKSKNNTILISDESEILEKKIKKIKTDEKRITITTPGNPTNCNIWKFHEIYSNLTIKKKIKTECLNAKIGCSECKNILYKIIENKNKEIIKNIKIYEKKESYINEIIELGTKNTRKIAENTLNNLKKQLNIL
ncbi:MAG TPA: tryptophan--tRNA ligase [Candidatus Azoamicus sp.]